MVLAGEQAATGRRCLAIQPPGIASQAGLEPASRVKYPLPTPPAKVDVMARPSRATPPMNCWPGNKRLRNVRRPKPLDDLSLRSGQDSNLRHPRDRRSNRDLCHRPRWVPQTAIPQKLRRGMGEESSEPLLHGAFHPSDEDLSLRTPAWCFGTTPPLRKATCSGRVPDPAVHWQEVTLLCRHRRE